MVGKHSFEKAYDAADRSGYNDSDYKRLKKFRDWIGANDVQDALGKAEGPLLAKIRFEINQLSGILKQLKNDIEKD